MDVKKGENSYKNKNPLSKMEGLERISVRWK
jgi:hypothetical protein